ncbi:fibrinogen-like protein A [Clavelina lepadiformis]|uniref:fibrinogen-like protein A n=1 Tax=Clavelina lepadiformis TaxID=159417 RepID=UPI0040421510
MTSLTTCFVLFIFLTTSFAQQCREVTRQVTTTLCDDDDVKSGRKGAKGNIGAPGKAGSPGRKGEKGDPGTGEKGDRGESCNLGSLGSEVQSSLEDLRNSLVPESCENSSIYGRQRLRNGEEAFCEGGWRVIQRRFDGSVDFQFNWDSYKLGFGFLHGEFWLGLDKIHNLTRDGNCKLGIDLWNFGGEHRFAQYNNFVVDDESDLYRLHVSGFSGTAGDSLDYHDNRPFTTKDRDNDDRGNCAESGSRKSGGWWFDNCFRASLNAAWGRSSGSWHNIIWNAWTGSTEALKATTMKIRCS